MSQNSYTQLGPYMDYVTSELRALTLQTYHDPLVLAFKVVFDYTKNYGLLADEENIDSALAYLKRIGETARYTMLKRWISVWKDFWSNYDFLVQQVDGMNVVENWKPQDNFNESEKVIFQIRETADMMFTGLLATYRQIWHDDTRIVEILPANMRRFDMTVIVFNSSYFNMGIYDIPLGSTIDSDKIPISQIEQVVFPTVRKLSDQEFSLDGTAKQFNHMLYKFADVNINTEESGSQFASSIVNEQSGTPLLQNLVVNFRFATYTGRFNNHMGNFDFSGLLAMIAAQNRAASLGAQVPGADDSLLHVIEQNFVAQAKAEFKETVKIVKNTFLGNNTFIGNIISGFTAENAAGMVNNTFGLGFNYIENALVVSPLAKLNNLLTNNFSKALNGLTTELDQTLNGKLQKGTSLATPQKVDSPGSLQPYIPSKNDPIKTIQYGEYNAYRKAGF